MTDYTEMLIDLLNDKISQLRLQNDIKQREINRLKHRIRELEKHNDKNTQETY